MSKNFKKKSIYPLDWPTHIPRTKSPTNSRFNTTLPKALNNVTGALNRLASDTGKKVDHIRLTSNVTMDDRPEDGGVALHFSWNDANFCIPVDRYKLPADNLQAIYYIIEADRTKIRHGGIAFVMAEKRGQTLMLEEGNEKPWHEVFNVDIENMSKSEIAEKVYSEYKRLVKLHHPDRGGNKEAFQIIQKARENAKSILKDNSGLL